MGLLLGEETAYLRRVTGHNGRISRFSERVANVPQDLRVVINDKDTLQFCRRPFRTGGDRSGVGCCTRTGLSGCRDSKGEAGAASRPVALGPDAAQPCASTMPLQIARPSPYPRRSAARRRHQSARTC